jgi:HTH-type transcriptional regulator, sugar sensing transcriptional regulator
MDVIDQFAAVGFTSQEARVYVALLQHPSATGYELAKATSLQRANVYQVLTLLLSRDAVQVVSNDPVRYLALPPADVLGRIKRETSARCDALIAGLAMLAPTPDPAAFWTLRGHDAVIARVSALITEATTRVAVGLWADDLKSLRAPLRHAHEAGCRVVINLFGSADLEFGEVYRHEETDKVIGGHLLTLAVDGGAAVVASLDEPAGAVYTHHAALVRLVEKLIRDEAYLAAIYERFAKDLEDAYGPHLLALRRRLLPPDQAEQLVSAVGFGASAGTFADILAGL